MKKGLFVLLLIGSFVAPAFAQTDCPTNGLGDQKIKKTADANNQDKKAASKQKGVMVTGC